MIKTVEKILKEGGIEEYQAEAKLIVSEISKLTLEDILLDKEVENFVYMNKYKQDLNISESTKLIIAI